MLDNIDKQLIKIIQENIPLTYNPFKEIANQLNITEQEVIQRIKTFIKKGIIRRFGAVLFHQKAGITANGMIVWNVPEDKIDKIGEKFASFKEVSHCYERPKAKNWNFNLYTMVHGKTKEDCYLVAKKLSEISGIKEYKILFSEKEFKKTSMKYFLSQEEL